MNIKSLFSADTIKFNADEYLFSQNSYLIFKNIFQQRIVIEERLLGQIK